MSELVVNLLTISLPLAFMALLLARVAASRTGRHALSMSGVALWLGIMAMASAMVFGVFSEPERAPQPPVVPVVAPDRLQACWAVGGIQMVYIEEAWTCVTADQAG